MFSNLHPAVTLRFVFPVRPSIIGHSNYSESWSRVRQAAELIYCLSTLHDWAPYLHEVAQDLRDPEVDKEQIAKLGQFRDQLKNLASQFSLERSEGKEWVEPSKTNLAAFLNSFAAITPAVESLIRVLALNADGHGGTDVLPLVQENTRKAEQSLVDCELKAAKLFDELVFPTLPWWRWQPAVNPNKQGSEYVFTVMSIDVSNSTDLANVIERWMDGKNLGAFYQNLAERFEAPLKSLQNLPARKNGHSLPKPHFDHRGDGVFILFADPNHALEFAIEFQRHEKKRSGAELEGGCRIGISTDDVRVFAYPSPTGIVQLVEMIGLGILNSHYCQKAAQANQIVICKNTWEQLDTLKAVFESDPFTVPKGKGGLKGYRQLMQAPSRKKRTPAKSKPKKRVR